MTAIDLVSGARLPDPEAVVLLDGFEVVDDTRGASETSKSCPTLWRRGGGKLPAIGHRRDTEIELIDANGAPVAPGERGTLRLRNRDVVAGYLNDTSASAFQDGWLCSGAAALVEADDRLRIADRADPVVNIMGNMVNAFVVDQALRTARGVQDAIRFRNPKPGAADELLAFVVLVANDNRPQAVASAHHAHQCFWPGWMRRRPA